MALASKGKTLLALKKINSLLNFFIRIFQGDE